MVHIYCTCTCVYLQAKCEFDTDMDTLIERLEKVCKLLKEDEVAQRSLALVLYGKQVLNVKPTVTNKSLVLHVKEVL